MLALIFTAPAITRYVDLNSPGPTPPYTSWLTAASNIQDAVDAAAAGDLVLVSNGVYQAGGRTAGAALTNRVVVDKPVTLQSMSGPLVTIIRGYQVPGLTNGDSAIRCIYLTNWACLYGFTLADGATRGDGLLLDQSEINGGGVYCAGAGVVVSNCELRNNSAFMGGGADGGTLIDCRLQQNAASYGGAVNYATLTRCILTNNFASRYGGGAYGSTLERCLIVGNSSAGSGGGASEGALTACVIRNNWASETAGGVYFGLLNNCIVISNTAPVGGGAEGGTLNNCTITGNTAAQAGGVYGGVVTLNNCIAYYNTGGNYSEFVTLYHCCALPKYNNFMSNFDDPPLFVDLAGGDLRLQASSPCIDAGHKEYVTVPVDVGGRPRIIGVTTDVGAYEFQAGFFTWLEQYGLESAGTADFADPDGDGMDNYTEWRADTIPTNSVSALRLVSATNSPSGAVVTWQSVSTRNYWLERASNLGVASPFQTIATNIVGTAGAKTFTDATAAGGGPYFYRVGVQ